MEYASCRHKEQTSSLHKLQGDSYHVTKHVTKSILDKTRKTRAVAAVSPIVRTEAARQGSSKQTDDSSNKQSSSSLRSEGSAKLASPRAASSPPAALKKSSAQVLRDKKKQTLITLQWLEENYCVCEGVCLPRNVLYAHYLDFCQKNKLDPACAATFGKTIRQKFPHLTTRRLGTRGHSKYHYYGVGVRETSEYYHAVYSSTGLTRFSGAQRHSEGGFTRKYSIGSKVGTLLPEFPSASYLILPDSVMQEKVETFLMMYRTHCQCILDTTINGAFKEIETFLLHFWQGLPSHMTSLLSLPVIETVICLCDSILAKTMVDVLIPATMQEMPETLLCDIRNLARHWRRWVGSALEALPSRLRQVKCQVAGRFSQYLQRQVSFLHLAQTSRPVLYDGKLVNQMIDDIDKIDVSELCNDFTGASVFNPDAVDSFDVGFAEEVLKEFKETLRKQATIESFIEWVDAVVEAKVMKPTRQSGDHIDVCAQQFLLRWSLFGSRLSHCLTLNNATSFGSVHLIRLLLDEYTFLAIESQIYQNKDMLLEEQVNEHTTRDESGDFPKYSSLPGSSFVASERLAGPSSGMKEEGVMEQSMGDTARHHCLPLPLHPDRPFLPSTSHLSHLNHLTQRINPDPAILTPPHSPLISGSDHPETQRLQHFSDCYNETASGYRNNSHSNGYGNPSYPFLYPSFNALSRDYDVDNMHNFYQLAYGNYMNGCTMQGFGNGYFGGIFPGYNMLEDHYHPGKTSQSQGSRSSTTKSCGKDGRSSSGWYKKPGAGYDSSSSPYGYNSSCRQSQNQVDMYHAGSQPFHCGISNNMVGHVGYTGNQHMAQESLYYDSLSNLSAIAANGYY